MEGCGPECGLQWGPHPGQCPPAAQPAAPAEMGPGVLARVGAGLKAAALTMATGSRLRSQTPLTIRTQTSRTTWPQPLLSKSFPEGKTASPLTAHFGTGWGKREETAKSLPRPSVWGRRHMVVLAGPGPAHLGSLPQRAPGARLAVRHPKARHPRRLLGAQGLWAPGSKLLPQGQVLPAGGRGSLLPGPRVGSSVPDSQTPRGHSQGTSQWRGRRGVGSRGSGGTTHRAEPPLLLSAPGLRNLLPVVTPSSSPGSWWGTGGGPAKGPHEGQGKNLLTTPPRRGP